MGFFSLLQKVVMGGGGGWVDICGVLCTILPYLLYLYECPLLIHHFCYAIASAFLLLLTSPFPIPTPISPPLPQDKHTLLIHPFIPRESNQIVFTEWSFASYPGEAVMSSYFELWKLEYSQSQYYFTTENDFICFTILYMTLY